MHLFICFFVTDFVHKNLYNSFCHLSGEIELAFDIEKVRNTDRQQKQTSKNIVEKRKKSRIPQLFPNLVQITAPLYEFSFLVSRVLQ